MAIFPDSQLEGGYPIKAKRSRYLPWGYDLDPTDSTRLLPDKDALDILNKGIDYISKSRLIDIAQWIERKTGRKITAVQLFNHGRARAIQRRRASYLEKERQAEESQKAADEASGDSKVH